jgi:pilus assembly protein CpaF
MADIDFGALTPLMQDPKIIRITVQNPSSIQVWHVDDGLISSDIHFTNDDEVQALAASIAAFVSMPFDYQHPITDVRLADGVRALLISRYVSSGGTVIHIEKAYDDEMTVETLVNIKALSQAAADFLLACVRGHGKITVVGGYHSGRKTTLNAITRLIPKIAPIVIIQPFNAIHLPEHTNVVKLESQQTAFMNVNHLNNKALLDAGLRLKPHRLIIAELDGTEISGVLNAMQNGLDTFFAMSATHPVDAVAHLETMATASNFSRPIMAIREQIADSLDVIVHVDLMADGYQRIVSVATIEGMQSDSINITSIFEREKGLAGGDLLPTGNIPTRTIQRLKANGVEVDEALFQV